MGFLSYDQQKENYEMAPVVYGLIDLYEVVKTENSFSAADITFSMILRSMFRSLLPVG